MYHKFSAIAVVVVLLCSYANADDRPVWYGPPPVLQQPKAQLRTAVANDEASVHTARFALDAANKSLKDIQDRLQAKFEAQPDWANAIKAVSDAKNTLDSLTKAAKAMLASNSDYVSAKAASDSADAKLAAARQTGNSSAIATWASIKLDATNKVTKMENDALAKDPKIQKAQDDLKTAKAAQDQLHKAFLDGLSDNPDWVAAKAKADDAKAKFVAANAQLQADNAILAQDLDQKRSEFNAKMTQYENSQHQ